MPNQANDRVSFRRFWTFCSEQLGSSRLQIHAQATTIQDFCGNSTCGAGSLRDIILASYKRSNCKKLDSAINFECTFDLLGETAYQLQGQHKDDLLDIELLEEIGWCINQFYASAKQNIDVHSVYATPTEFDRTSPTQPPTQGHVYSRRAKPAAYESQVYSLQNAKLKKANSQL